MSMLPIVCLAGLYSANMQTAAASLQLKRDQLIRDEKFSKDATARARFWTECTIGLEQLADVRHLCQLSYAWQASVHGFALEGLRDNHRAQSIQVWGQQVLLHTVSSCEHAKIVQSPSDPKLEVHRAALPRFQPLLSHWSSACWILPAAVLQKVSIRSDSSCVLLNMTWELALQETFFSNQAKAHLPFSP